MVAKPAAPMSYERRLASYGGREKSGGAVLDLTPRQRRRLNHKRNHAAARARQHADHG